MIQSHQQLVEVSSEYNILFSKNEFYPVQKAYTTPHFIVLTVRFPGKNAFLYIGRGNKYEGIFLGEYLPPSYLRVQDKFLDYLRKNLVGSRLGKMEVDRSHFFALFPYKNDQSNNSFSFGYKNHQLYFINQKQEEIYTSWNNEVTQRNSLVKIIDNFLGESSLSDKSIKSQFLLSDYFKNEEKKKSGAPVQAKKEKFLKKKIGNIKNDLNDVVKWKNLEHDLLTGVEMNIPDKEAIFYNIKIKFPSNINEWQKRDALFNKVKKLKKAENILTQRLAETELELENVMAGKISVEATKEHAVALLWQSQKTALKKNSDRKTLLFSIGQINGIIGLDAQSNDLIRSEAAKDHYWFHVENYTGSHCVIKTDDISKIKPLEFEALASLLRDYSKLDILEIPVIYSQVKHVKGLKGTAGKVLVKKPKYLRCQYRPWKEIITLNE
ncbi:MAG: hypothetical protein HOP07_10750 [Bacteriovoracaceae bacterium]|nr:hypothetical protein [Bacteriovoracaceae bacterium]